MMPAQWPEPGARAPGGVRARLHDFGPAGHMTAEEAASVSGLLRCTIESRIRRGVAPEHRLLPARSIPGQKPSDLRARRVARGRAAVPGSSSVVSVRLGMRLWRMYGPVEPTIDQLRELTGLSRSQAYRVLAEYRDEIASWKAANRTANLTTSPPLG